MPIPAAVGAALIGGGAALGNTFMQNQSSRRAQNFAQRNVREGRARMDATQRPYMERAFGDIDPTLRGRYQEYMDSEPRGAYAEGAYDPTGLINALMSQYRESPLNEYKRETAMTGMRQSAAAGGYGGLENEQSKMAELSSLFADENMMQWLTRALEARAGGLAGLQGQADMGVRGMQIFSDQGSAGAANVGGAGWNEAQQQAGLGATGIGERTRNNRDLMAALAGVGQNLYSESERSTQPTQPTYNRFNMPANWSGVPFAVR